MTASKSLDDMVAAFKASGAKLACLCSSDKVYESEAADAAKALTAAGAIVHLAGRPGENEENWRKAGVKDIHLRRLRRAFDPASCACYGELDPFCLRLIRMDSEAEIARLRHELDILRSRLAHLPALGARCQSGLYGLGAADRRARGVRLIKLVSTIRSWADSSSP